MGNLSNGHWVVLGNGRCKWCEKVMELLASKKIKYTYMNLDMRPDLTDFIKASGLTTIPQVYLNGERIGGFEATEEHLKLLSLGMV